MRESFEESGLLDGKNIPLAEIVLSIGFFLIYFVEEFVHFLCDSELHIEDNLQEITVKRRKRSAAVHR